MIGWLFFSILDHSALPQTQRCNKKPRRQNLSTMSRSGKRKKDSFSLTFALPTPHNGSKQSRIGALKKCILNRAIYTSICSFAHPAQSFAYSAVRPAHFILALHCGAALNRKLAHLLTHSRARGNMNDSMSQHPAVLNYSTPTSKPHSQSVCRTESTQVFLFGEGSIALKLCC